MAHVQIKFEKNGTGSVTVDGIEVPVLADGFGVEFPPEFGARPIVRMQVLADMLDVDLADAAVASAPADEPQTLGDVIEWLAAEKDGLAETVAANTASLARLTAQVNKVSTDIEKAMSRAAKSGHRRGRA